MTAGPAARNLSPELKQLIQEWCAEQESKYGPNWKQILAKEMAARTIAELKANGVLKNVK